MNSTNTEVSMNGKAAMDGVEEKVLGSETNEKDSNANEPEKKLTNGTNGVENPEEIESPESKTVVESEGKEHDQSSGKENDTDTESLPNRRVDKKSSGDEAVGAKSTKGSQGSEAKSSAGKDVKINGEDTKGESGPKEGKRKRRISSIHGRDSPAEKSERMNKRKRSRSNEDKFCWRCHKESVDSQCTACPRAWHRRCMGGSPQSSQNWICGECATILKAENAETISPAMAQLSVEQLCTLLRHVVGRMRDNPGSEPFWKAVDVEEVPNYLDFVVKPMDLTLLESNVRAKLYGSTEAFMADAKWIQHNCIVFNTCGGVYTDTSKLTNAARQMIKVARQEVSEIEACPDCYGHARNLPRPQPSWFIEPCRRPHPLVWAKLKGFPFWPAKAMSRVNGQGHVDVRFFGAHDRAWVPPRDLYLYSEDPPAPLPRKRKSDMEECVREITRHCKKLEMVFGQFKFAPPKIQYNPRDPSQIKLMLPNYDPLQPGNPTGSLNVVSRRKPPGRKRSVIPKKKSPVEEAAANSSDSGNEAAPPKRDLASDCEDHNEASRIPKVSLVPIKRKKSESPAPRKDEANANSRGKRAMKRKSVVSNHAESSFDDNTKTDDEIQTDQENRILNKSSDGQSSSENDVSLEIRKSLKSDSNSSHKGKDLGMESSTKSHKSDGDNGASQDHKMKAKNSPKTNRNQVRVYKPKTRMVNQVNAERAKAKNRQNDSSERLDSSSHDQSAINLLASTAIDASAKSSVSSGPNYPVRTVNNSILNAQLLSGMNGAAAVPPLMPSTFLVNNGTPESGKRNRSLKDRLIMNEASTSIKQEPQEHHFQKKESKARKSFMNKPPVFPQISTPSPPKPPASPPDAMVYIPSRGAENDGDYSLLPPEAGPLSAQLHRGGQELAKRLAQLMEEALAEAAQINSNQDKSEINERATVHHLTLQIERMRWQHQQHLAELKHNTDLTLREMKASLEAERYRAVEETKREAEEEMLRSIEETKRKQWCALCGNEAQFYCCWNTSYCDYPCQQAHWTSHMRSCAQNPPPNANTTAGSNANQQQNGPMKQCAPAGNMFTLRNGESRLVPTTTPLPTIKAIQIQQR